MTPQPKTNFSGANKLPNLLKKDSKTKTTTHNNNHNNKKKD